VSPSYWALLWGLAAEMNPPALLESTLLPVVAQPPMVQQRDRRLRPMLAQALAAARLPPVALRRPVAPLRPVALSRSVVNQRPVAIL
jgi:hypothetical protein